VQDLQTDPREFITNVLAPRPPTWWQRAYASVGIRPKVDSSFHLVTEIDADDVLRELSDDANERVAGFAKDVLGRVRIPPAQLGGDLDYLAWIELICKHHREPQDAKKVLERE
jgi:hypothetical protein